MNRVLIATYLLGVAWPFAPAARADEPTLPKELQGTWKLVSIEREGESREPLGGGSPRWIIKGDKVYYGGEEIIQLTADASTNPKVVDMKYLKPDRVYEGIYSVEKDSLKICLNKKTEGTKDRPSKFSTKDQADWILLIFEREQAAPAKATEGLTAFAGVMLRKDDETNAAAVVSAFEGSPAAKAGLKKGDVVVKVGGVATADLQSTIKAVRAAKPGDKLEFTITRDGKELAITVTVGVMPFHWVAGLE